MVEEYDSFNILCLSVGSFHEVGTGLSPGETRQFLLDMIRQDLRDRNNARKVFDQIGRRSRYFDPEDYSNVELLAKNVDTWLYDVLDDKDLDGLVLELPSSGTVAVNRNLARNRRGL